jgi:hypothetical protein
MVTRAKSMCVKTHQTLLNFTKLRCSQHDIDSTSDKRSGPCRDLVVPFPCLCAVEICARGGHSRVSGSQRAVSVRLFVGIGNCGEGGRARMEGVDGLVDEARAIRCGCPRMDFGGFNRRRRVDVQADLWGGQCQQWWWSRWRVWLGWLRQRGAWTRNVGFRRRSE